MVLSWRGIGLTPMKRRSKKKSGGGKGIILILILIGIGLFGLIHFRQEIEDALKPPAVKRTAAKEKREVTLFFSDQEGEYLVGEKRTIAKGEDVEKEAKDVIVELTRGPKGRLVPTLPSHAQVLGFELDEGGLARVSFNRALSKDHPGGTTAETMTVYSIVNSLSFNFPRIKRVQILVEGKEIETIAGHLSLKRPIPSNFNLVKGMARKEAKQ
jgi:spore germination protein GerM